MNCNNKENRPRTCGQYKLETDTEIVFDEVISKIGLFASETRVRGTIAYNQKIAQKTGIEIDRLLFPKESFFRKGWTHGIIGVELKKSGEKLGRPYAQALDYLNSIFKSRLLRNSNVCPSVCVIFPVEKIHGPMASMMAQTRVGCMDLRKNYHGKQELIAFLGEQILFKIETDPMKVVQIMEKLPGDTNGRR